MFQLHSMPRRPVHWPEECPVRGLPGRYSAAQQQFVGQNVLHGMRGGSQGCQPSRLQVQLSVHWQGRQALRLHCAGRVSIADIHVPVFGTKGFLTGLQKSLMLQGSDSSVGRIWLKRQAQYWCRFKSPVWHRIFLPGSAFSSDSLTVYVQHLLCSHMHQHL